MNINTLNNSLFTVTSPTHSRLSAYSISTRSSPLNQKDNWNLRDLQMKMKKSVRKEVSAASMNEQLKFFFSLQKGVALMKLILLIAVNSLLYQTTSMDGALGFSFLLLILTELFSTTVFSFTDVNLVKNVRNIQPLIYCSIFYSCLKSLTGIKKNEINWTYTFIAIVATLVHEILNFYKPFLNSTGKKIVTKATQQKRITANLLIFPRYLIERIQATLKITQHLILAIGIIYSLAVPLFIIFRIFSFGIFQPRFLFYSLPLFIILQCYFILLDYINMAFSLDLRICRVIKDKIPVLINLLRLQNTPFNRLVQSQCIKCLFMKLEKEPDFLASQTIKSLLYGTYMDIFDQFSRIQLERINNQMQQHLIKIKRNDKFMKLKKGLLEDLLIYFKKIATLFQSEWQASKIMELAASLDFLFLITNKIDNVANGQSVNISRRAVCSTNNIKQRIKQCSQCISISNYTQRQLANYYQILRSESTEI